MMAPVVDEGTGRGLHASSAPNPGRARPRGRSAMTAGLVIGALVLLAIVPACSSSPTPAAVATSTTTSVTVTVPNQNPAEIAACTADPKTVEGALRAFDLSPDICDAAVG